MSKYAGYQDVAWGSFNAYMREKLGIPSQLEGVIPEAIEFNMYPSAISDDGFKVLQEALISRDKNPRTDMLKRRIETYSGILSMNYGTSVLMDKLNAGMLRFQSMGTEAERSSLAAWVVELCLIPLLERDTEVEFPTNSKVRLPTRKDMNGAIEELISSPFFPVEFMILDKLKQSVIVKIRDSIEKAPMSVGDLEAFITSKLQARSVEILAFSVFTAVLRYAEIMTKFSTFFALSSSSFTDLDGVVFQRSAFCAGLRKGIGTNLGRGGRTVANMDDVLSVSAYGMFIEDNPILLSLVYKALPTYIDRNLEPYSTIVNAFNAFASKDGAHGDMVRAFLRHYGAEKACLDETANEILDKRVHLSKYASFVGKQKK